MVMTDTIKRKKNTGEPGNGGQFGSSQHVEADTTLLSGQTVPMFVHLRKQAAEARELMWIAAERAIAETAHDADPDTAKVLFSWYTNEDGGQLLFRKLIDHDGEELEISDEARRQLDELADVFDDNKRMAKIPQFEPLDDDAYDAWGVDSGYFFDVGAESRHRMFLRR